MKSLAKHLESLALGSLVLVTAGFSNAQDKDLTFYADALPVLQKNCVACHQENGPRVGGISAPMALDDYEQAKIWAPLIKNALITGYMPPWGAHERHRSEFKDERYIDQKEKDLLIAWVESGAQKGDPADAPSADALVANRAGTTLPESGWWIGNPDLVVQFEEQVYVPDQVEDWQPTIQMPVPEGAHENPKWISRTELDPGGPWVHHIVSSHMGVGVPGRGPFSYPAGWGVLLPEDPFITVNIHYHKTPGEGTAVEDLTRAGFLFYEEGEVIDHVVETNLLPHSGWTIPAGSTLHMSWWFDNSEGNRFNPDPTASVQYGLATTDEMANARIYYAPTTPRGIVVGEPLPEDVLTRARREDSLRRERSNVFDPGVDDFSWLEEDSK